MIVLLRISNVAAQFFNSFSLFSILPIVYDITKYKQLIQALCGEPFKQNTLWYTDACICRRQGCISDATLCYMSLNEQKRLAADTPEKETYRPLFLGVSTANLRCWMRLMIRSQSKYWKSRPSTFKLPSQNWRRKAFTE